MTKSTRRLLDPGRIQRDAVLVAKGAWPYLRTRVLVAVIALVLLPLGSSGPLPAATVVAIYAVGVTWAFSLIVVLKPLVRSALGSGLLGAAAAAGLVAATFHLAYPADSLHLKIGASIIACLILGGLPGIVVWMASER